MKSSIIIALLLLSFPTWILDLGKDKLKTFASLSYYDSDFDGDKKTDLALWNSETKTLYFQLTSTGQFYNKKFFDHEVAYEPVFADYDGDGKTDFGFYQQFIGEWVLFLTSGNDSAEKTLFGNHSDLPIPTNLDGDSKYELTIWRPNASTWLILEEDDQGNKIPRKIYEGNYQDSVFAGDYDGDGKSDLSVWRPDDGNWHIVKSGTNFDFDQSEHIQHGKEWDIIVPNDYNADGRCDLVFWRPEDKTWYFLYAGSQNKNQIQFGNEGDIPLSKDLNGDGIPELITWTMSKKTWNVYDLKTKETLAYKWDVPDGCLPAVSILQKFE